MSHSGSSSDLLNDLAHEFAERCRRGEHPALTEYTDKYPELAAEIRDLFPALAVMEELGSAAGPPTGPYPGPSQWDSRVPERMGEYRILREVARGGMGIVYEAVQESLGRHVALKVLPLQRLTQPTHLERFRREAKAVARLHHTNIVPVFGVGEHEGVHYYAMQFINGQGLDSVLKEVKKLRSGGSAGPVADDPPEGVLSVSIARSLVQGFPGPVAEPACGASFQLAGSPGKLKTYPTGVELASRTSSESVSTATAHADRSNLGGSADVPYFRSVAQLGLQVAEALAHAHQQGVLHRDIKPSNLLLDTQGTVWITDFGLAKAEGTEDLTSPGDIVGTLRYMAPERFQGQCDSRGDVYSLGLTLYELLTLRPAFAASERAQLIDRLLHDRPPRPRVLDARIPRDLETIVLKAMAREPGERYPTATALAEDLRRFLADRPIHARRSSWREHTWRWCRRNPAVASLTASVLALLAVGVVVLAVSTVRISWEKNQKDIALKEKDNALTTAGANYREARAQEKLAKDNEKAAKAQELLARRRYYAAQMNLAYQAWEAGNIARVLDLLESQRPKLDEEDLRTFEWYYLWRLCSGGRRLTLRGHSNNVFSIASSPDGKTLVSGSTDGTAKLWDLATGQVRLTLPVSSSSVAFSPDGKMLACGSWDKPFLRLWDVSTGRLLRTFQGGQGYVWSVAFSPDGKTLVSGSQDQTVGLWDVATGQARATLRGQGVPVLSVAVSPDGKTIASSTTWGTAVKVWDVATCKERFTLGAGHPVAFSPDGTLAIGGGSVALWDVMTGQPRPKRPGVSASALAFSPDGRTLALAGHDKNVRLWDVATGQMRVQHGRHARINAIAFSPDGKTLATAGNDATIELWDVAPANEPTTLAHAGGAFALAFSPDGKTLASGGHSGTRLWDVPSGQPIAAFTSVPSTRAALAFSHDGQTLAIAQGNAVKLTDVATRQELHTLAGHGKVVFGIAFGPDKKTLGSISEDGTLKLWDLATASARTTFHVLGTRMCLAYSPDGRTLATGGQHLLVDLWDPATGALKAKLESPEGEHFQWMQAVAFSPDGKTLAASGDQGSLKLWNMETGTLQVALRGHTETIVSLAFSPDGKTLASGCTDRTVKLWDVATGQERVTLKGFAAWASVAFSPDGASFAMVGEDGSVKLLRATTDSEARARKNELDVDDPANPLTLITAGNQLWKAGRPDEAEKAYRQALASLDKLAAKFPNVDAYRQELARGGICLSLLLLQAGRLEEALPVQARTTGLIEKLSPDSKHAVARRCCDLGDLLLAGGLAESAQRAFSQAIDLAPGEWQFWDRRGRTFLRLRQDDKAVADFTKAIECQPANWLPHADRGTAHRRLQQWDKAIADYSKSIEHGAPREWVWAGRADCYAQLGQWEKAAADFEKVIELKPEEAEAWYRRGQAYGQLGQGAKAVADYFKAIELAKDNQTLAALVRKRLETDFAKALQAKPDDPKLWIACGRFYSERGDPKKADAHFAKAAALTPDELNRFLEAGWWVVGPYPYDLKLPCPPQFDADPARPVAAFMPLHGLAAASPFAGLRLLGSLSVPHFDWKPCPTDEYGTVRRGHPTLESPSGRVSVYGLTYVYSPDERATTLLVGGDRMRVWLNGRLVHESTKILDSPWGMDRVPIMLKPGRNTLLVRPNDDNGSFYFRVRLADNPLDRGFAAAEVGLWDEAAGHFAKAFDRRPPDDSFVWYSDALARMLAGDVEGYRRQCTQMGQRFGPDAADVHVIRSLALNPTGARDAAGLLRVAQKAYEAAPKENWSPFNLGVAHYRAGQFEPALRRVQEAQALSEWYLFWPMRAMIHHRLGQADQARDWLQKAEQHYQKALREASGRTPFKVSAEVFWQDWAYFEVFLREAQTLIKGAPPKDDPWLRLLRGKAYAQLGELKKSNAEFQAALALKADDPTLWIARGRFYAERGDHKKADIDFAKAATLTPQELNKFIEAGWWVVGPYPGDLKIPCPPEKGPDPSRPASSARADQSTFPWRHAPTTAYGGAAFHELVDRTEHASVYALSYVFSPQERSAMLLVGGGDRVRLWLNGRFVHQTTEENGWWCGFDRVPVTLRAGRNTLLARVSNTSGRPQLLYLYLRIADGPLDRGWALAEMGLWDQAATSFTKGFEQAVDSEPYLHAPVLLLAGKVEAYRRHCAWMLNRFGGTSSPDDAYHVAQSCSLAPEGTTAPDRLLELAKKAQRPDLPGDHYRQFQLGLAHYRAGQFEQAIRFFNEHPDVQSLFSAMAVRAMAHQRLGRAAEARKWLAKVEESFTAASQQALEAPNYKPATCAWWVEWAWMQIFYREAKILIEGAVPKENSNVAALRVRAQEELSKRDQTTAAFDHAVMLQPDQPRLWLARGRRYAELKRWKAADADLDKAAELKADDPQVWAERGRVYAEHGQPDKAATDFTRALALVREADEAWGEDREGMVTQLVRWDDVFARVVKLRPTDKRLWLARMQRFARAGDWAKASAAAARWMELDPDEHLHLAWFYQSVLRLQLGDVQGYRKVCQDMLTRFGQTKELTIAERTARSCLLAPAALDDLKPVFQLAEQLVTGTEKHWGHRWFLLTRGAADYRAGKYASAIDWLRKSLDASQPVPQRDAFATLFLAMAQYRVGQTTEARRLLKQAGQWMEERARSLEPGDLGVEWSDWMRIQIVHREAEQLIHGSAPGSGK